MKSEPVSGSDCRGCGVMFVDKNVATAQSSRPNGVYPTAAD